MDQKFDLKKFNTDFDSLIQEDKQKQNKLLNDKLNDLNKVPSETKLYELSTKDLLIGLKDTWFGIFDEIIKKFPHVGISLYKKHRLFYVGLTLIIFALLVFVCDVMFEL